MTSSRSHDPATRRPTAGSGRSAATVAGVIAVLLCLGAGSVAVADLVVRTRDIADGAVTGKKIDERSLDAVPRAETVDGLSALKFRHRSPFSQELENKVVFRMNGLVVKSMCILQQPDIAFPTMTAYTRVNDAVFRFGRIRYSAAYQSGSSDFDRNDSMPLTEGGEGEGMITFTFSNPNRKVVSGEIGYGYKRSNCLIDGTALGG